jgi:hypothetical protein
MSYLTKYEEIPKIIKIPSKRKIIGTKTKKANARTMERDKQKMVG